MKPNQAELREKLAAIEHERWADWQSWVHNQGHIYEDKLGKSLVLPWEVVERWNRQILTSYASLSDKEKASDMEQVDRYWHLIEAYVTQALATQRKELIGRLPKDYVPKGHDPEACGNHEKYTSACCGCQRQKTRVFTLSEVKSILEGEE